MGILKAPGWLVKALNVECPFCHDLMIFWEHTTNTYSLRDNMTIYFHKRCGNRLPESMAHYSTVSVIVCKSPRCDWCKLQYSVEWHRTGKKYARENSRFITIAGEQFCPRHVKERS